MRIGEFSTYLHYCRALRFEDRPDYIYLKKLFMDVMGRESMVYDLVFDWTLTDSAKLVKAIKEGELASADSRGAKLSHEAHRDAHSSTPSSHQKNDLITPRKNSYEDFSSSKPKTSAFAPGQEQADVAQKDNISDKEKDKDIHADNDKGPAAIFQYDYP